MTFTSMVWHRMFITGFSFHGGVLHKRNVLQLPLYHSKYDLSHGKT